MFQTRLAIIHSYIYGVDGFMAEHFCLAETGLFFFTTAEFAIASKVFLVSGKGDTISKY